MCRFLTRNDVDPTNLERMKVKYARDVFMLEVVAALRRMNDLNEQGFENVETQATFLEFFGNGIVTTMWATSISTTTRELIRKSRCEYKR